MQIRLRNRFSDRGPRRRPLRYLVAAGLAVLALALSWGSLRAPVGETQASTPPLEQLPVAAALPAHAPAQPPEPVVQREVQAGLIRPGDTISALLGDHLTPQQIHELARQSKAVFPLTRICAGQPYELCTVDGEFEQFVYDIDREEQLRIALEDDRFQVETVPIVYEVRVDPVEGTILSNLFEAVSESGEEPQLAIDLSDIFAWDIDFIRDIRRGDAFQALVERRFRDGEPAGYGRILAAEFVNQGQVYRAVLFQDGDRGAAYYDPEGNSLRKAFLKAPLSFSRISSGFSTRRFHPVTKTWKAHPAIDYAAPTGTPIKTVGDGVVQEKGYTTGNGNYVKIRHNSTYSTLYLHMSRFARGLRKGKKISQGDIIGYVGATGLATGPHLCFRMYKNGSPVNPLRQKSTSAEPVSKGHLAEFQALAAPLLARFDTGADSTLQLANIAETPPAGTALAPQPPPEGTTSIR
ncbi:MAG TPA: peptidoglycan DD-metalloendopeptidase family protein [Deferrisomatales bacterium]|nr:peptidoglycan DD-metalloendopeptidase family protein [Deferrisomatales bacterium]